MIIDKRLRKLSPLWYKKISRVKTLKGLLRKTTVRQGLVVRELDLASYGCCMIGEAFGFDRAYINEPKMFGNPQYCKTCFALSDAVIVPPRNSDTMTIGDFQKIITKFCDHVEKVHGITF